MRPLSRSRALCPRPYSGLSLSLSPSVFVGVLFLLPAINLSLFAQSSLVAVLSSFTCRNRLMKETRITDEQMLRRAMQVRARVARQMMRAPLRSHACDCIVTDGPVPVSPLAPEFFCSARSGCLFGPACHSVKYTGCLVPFFFKEELN